MPSFETTTENGIERVVCKAENTSSNVPILFVHGMWHGAWCWKDTQEAFADKGYSSVAISLPGHAGSDPKNIRFATMGSYLKVIESQVSNFSSPPILIGHSMGAALIQWLVKYGNVKVHSVILVASWTSHSTFWDGTLLHLSRDPLGFLLMGFTFSTDPLIRNPEVSASMLLGQESTISPKDLHSQLCTESYLVLCQHNPPLWFPAKTSTKMLWIAAEQDAVITLKGAKGSAEWYGADYLSFPGGHDLMYEKNWLPEIVPKMWEWISKVST